MTIQRGCVYWVDLEPTAGSQQRGRRRCLVLSVDPINAVRRTVGVIPLSSSPKVAEPIVVAVPSIGPQTVAICDQLRAVDKRKIDRSSDRRCHRRGTRGRRGGGQSSLWPKMKTVRG